MFIRYKNGRKLFFYDKNKNLISGKDGQLKFKGIPTFYFWADKDVYYFTLERNAGPYWEINKYDLNRVYTIRNTITKIDYNITFLSILQKAKDNTDYQYNNQSFYTFFEGSNIKPSSNDILFRDDYKINENNRVYLSKYIEDYYPALAVSPPNFIFKDGKYCWDPGSNLGPDPNKKASSLYKAYQNDNKIPFTLFLKPNYRQWFSNRVLFKTPGTYKCKYDYNARKLTIYNNSGNVIDSYTNVPHTITICCQGAGGGGDKGDAAGDSGWGGSAGGFIAANCFLGNNVTTFTIQVGSGGKSDEKGQPSYVEIKQEIDLISFASEENPTLAYYEAGREYKILKSTLKLEGEGGGAPYPSGIGKITAGASSISGENNETPEGEKGKEESRFFRSLFFKPLFCLEGGYGGRSGRGGIPVIGEPEEPWDGKQSSFASFSNFLSDDNPLHTPEDLGDKKDVIMTWNSDGSLSLKGEVKYNYNKNKSLDSALILGGPSLKEALDTTGLKTVIETNDIYVDFYRGGYAGSTANIFEPGGGGGGSSLFGYGGDGGAHNHNNGYDGWLGAGGGGGKGGVDVGKGGKGGNGAVWLIW